MNILLTGAPGVGKTTLVMKILDRLHLKAKGFYTEEIRDKGVRKGFRVKTLDGEEGVLSHVDTESPHRVGKYHVNVEEFEQIGVVAVEEALKEKSPVVIDEIGKMELYSKRFRDAVLRALDESPVVIATIAAKGDAFVEQIKARPDVGIMTITPQNRDRLADEVGKVLARENQQ